jgi:hypothetical protein
MNMDHDVIRFRKLPQPFSFRTIEVDAIRAVAELEATAIAFAPPLLIISSMIGRQPSSSAWALAITANSPG